MGFLPSGSKIVANNSVDYDMNALSFRESLLFSKNISSLNISDVIISFLDKVTTLDLLQIKQLSLQKAFSISFQYLVVKFDNPEVYQEVFASDFLLKGGKYENELTIIDKVRFNSSITLGQFCEAEKHAYIKGDNELLGAYILSETCLKGRNVGLEILINKDDSIDRRNNIKLLNDRFLKFGEVNINLLHDLENISICTTNKENMLAKFNPDVFFYK